MATPQASDLMTDTSKWLKALDAGSQLLKINRSLASQMERIAHMTNEASKITDDAEKKSDFLIAMKQLHKSSEAVLVVGKKLNEVEQTMNKTLKEASKSASVETIKDCIKKLKTLLKAGKEFSEKHEDFKGRLDEATKECTLLIAECERSKTAKESGASSTRWKGYGGATALGAASAGSLALGIAGFFTGGAAWVAWGALVAGSAATGGLAAGAYSLQDSTCLDARKLDEESREFEKSVQNLGRCMKELEVLSNSLDADIKISQEVVSAITDVLATYQERHRVLQLERDLQKREELVKRRMEELGIGEEELT